MQLLYPGSAYEVSNELESFFFVVFYEGVHWIIHNKPPGLDLEHIFDDVRVDRDGTQRGGGGKQTMYTSRQDVVLQKLEFQSSRFTELVRELFRLFQSLFAVNQAKKMNLDTQGWTQYVANVEKLNNCDEIARLMKAAVEWPEECDKAKSDNYPRQEEIDRQDRIGVANLKVATQVQVVDPSISGATDTADPSRTSKRGREDDDEGYTTPTKRSRVEVV